MFVLVHSPLVGPRSWTGVAEQLRHRGLQALVPAVPVPEQGPRVIWRQQVDAVLEAVLAVAAGPSVLVAHSGAGPLLPLIAAESAAPVAACLFVDAGLPHPGRSRADALPAPALQPLRDLERDGWLPPWHEWFGGEQALAALVPDPQLRAEFVAELRPLPWRMFTEPWPAHPAQAEAPCAHLRLSAACDAAAEEAERRLWPVLRAELHHLAVLTEPAAVADALGELGAAVRR